MLLREAKQILKKNGYRIVEDTDELDDADLPVGMDAKEYHKRKGRMRSLKDRVIEAWYAWAERYLGTKEARWKKDHDNWRFGNDEEKSLVKEYEKLYGKPFKSSNKIDMMEFYRCLFIGNGSGVIDDIKYKGYRIILNKIFEQYDKDRMKTLFNECMKGKGWKYLNDMGLPVKYTRNDEKWIELAVMLYKKHHNFGSEGLATCLAMTEKDRQNLFNAFMKMMTVDKIYRNIDVDGYTDMDIEDELAFEDISDEHVKMLMKDKEYRRKRQFMDVNLEYPGKSWSFDKHNSWSGNMVLVGENDINNVDLTMSALCFGNWSTFNKDLTSAGEREVRVMSERDVTILDVFDKSSGSHLDRKETYIRY